MPATSTPQRGVRISGLLLGLGLCLLGGRGSLQAQDPARLIVKADRLAWLNNWSAAGPLFARAEELATKAGDNRNAVYARIGRLRAEVDSMSYPEVSEYLGRQLESTLVEQDLELKLRCLTAKASIDSLLRSPAESRPLWEMVQDVAEAANHKGWESRASGELGILAFLDGDSSSALELVGTALSTARKTGDVGAQVRYMGLTGRAFVQFGRSEEALQFFDRAIVASEGARDAGFAYIAHVGKAEALLQMGRTAAAKRLLERALRQARRNRMRGYESEVLKLLGGAYAAAGERKRAIEFLEAAAALALQTQLNRLLAPALLELAKLYRDSGDLRKAEETAALSVEAIRKVAEIYSWPAELTVRADLARSRRDFAEADDLYSRATDVIEGMLVNTRSPTARSSLVAAMSDTYVKHFSLALTELRDIGKAFVILEHARGRSAADMLRSRPDEPSDEPAPRNEVDAEIARLQLELRRAENPRQRQDLLAKLFEAEQRLAWASQYIPIGGQPIELSQVEAILRPDELFLEYVLSDPHSYCLVVSRTGTEALRLASRRVIEGLVERHLADIQARRVGREAARELYSLLLEPVAQLDEKSRLIIVPDGKLHALPFGSLLDRRGRYVLYRHPVSAAPSGTVLYLLRTAERRVPSLPFLGVGDVSYSANDDPGEAGNATGQPLGRMRGLYDEKGVTFPPLPSTMKEVVEAGRIFGDKSVVLLGKNATEASFKREPLSEFEILHLAVHGIASSDHPERAALVFGYDPEAGEDGLLQAREISRLRLSADLVTLSACNTGQGRIEGQEGVANLVRAFLFAGARSVVASLWLADDVFTSALMRRFYAHLAAQQDKVSALRQAKLDLIGQYGDQITPFHWAGFTLVGEGATPTLPQQ